MSRLASQPLRQLLEEERKELQRVSRASSEARIRHQRVLMHNHATFSEMTR